MFILISRYLKPLAEIERVLAEHRRHLQIFYDSGIFHASGPREPRTGGVILASGTREQIDAFLRDDPFVREGISDYEVIEFHPAMQSGAFRALSGNPE